MERRMIVIAAVILSAVVSGAFILANAGKLSQAVNDDACLPKTLDSVVTDFPVKQPDTSTMPAGFQLEGVDYAGGTVIMFYADHSLCPLTESYGGLIDKGAIVISVNKSDEVKDSVQFQNEELEYYANQPETLAKVEPITINGNKGIGWEPFNGTDTVRIDGKVISQEPIKMPGWVRFYDDQDGTIYGIRGHQPLQVLVRIAESLQ